MRWIDKARGMAEAGFLAAGFLQALKGRKYAGQQLISADTLGSANGGPQTQSHYQGD
jgi:hypothetical protein